MIYSRDIVRNSELNSINLTVHVLCLHVLYNMRNLLKGTLKAFL